MLERLMEDIEEEYDAVGFLALYQILWAARGLSPGESDTALLPLVESAYHQFRSRHDTRLVWLPWPTDPEAAIDAEAEDQIRFDLEEHESVRLLALLDA